MEITKDDAPQFHTIEYFSGMLKTDPVSDIATQKCKVEDLAHNLVSLIQSCSIRMYFLQYKVIYNQQHLSSKQKIRKNQVENNHM